MPGELLFEVINLNKAIMQGIELSVDYSPFTWMRWSAGYTYLDARDVSEVRFNDVLPYKSKHTGFASLFLEHGKLNFFLQGRGRSRIDEVFIYPGSEPDGYLLFNSKISYSFQKNVSAFLSVQNITNEMYEEIERYRLQGRTYAMGFNYRIQ